MRLLFAFVTVLLLLAPTKASAKMDFGSYCEVVHTMTVNEPWLELRVCFYDTNGTNSGFAVEQYTDGYLSPYLEIDGKIAASLEKLHLDFRPDAESWFDQLYHRSDTRKVHH